MATSFRHIDRAPGSGSDSVRRLYTACFFDQGLLVPRVKLFDAASDAEAIAEICSVQRFTKRELWDRHRLVTVIPPEL